MIRLSDTIIQFPLIGHLIVQDHDCSETHHLIHLYYSIRYGRRMPSLSVFQGFSCAQKQHTLFSWQFLLFECLDYYLIRFSCLFRMMLLLELSSDTIFLSM